MKICISILILAMITLFSCKNENINLLPENLWIDNLKPKQVKELSVKTRVKTEIRTNSSAHFIIWSNGKDISPNKIRAIDYYDSDGFCILKIIPSYKMIPNDTTGFSKLSSINQLFFQKEVESNEPTGYADSTFYYYDENDKLIKTEYHKTTNYGISYLDYIDTYTYDKVGNITQKCSVSENSSTFCGYTTFKYDENKKIISTTDSFTVDIQRPERQNKGFTRIYKYNTNGLISSINDEYYIYNEDNLLVEKYSLSGKVKTNIEYYTYDSNGNCVKIENIRSISSSFDPKTNTTTVESYDTSLFLKQFDKNNLLIESSNRYSKKSKDYTLYKYEYTYLIEY
jgi:hypothetical protein